MLEIFTTDNDCNQISTGYFNDDGELTLTFTFALDLPDIEAGTPEAKAFTDELEESYLQSVAATLAHLRELVEEGKI